MAYVKTTESRNPVFALEMIQTERRFIAMNGSKGIMSQSSIRPGDDSDYNLKIRRDNKIRSRNPVFALEMIQTRTHSPHLVRRMRSVAIQYSPWR